ncbi:MAG: sigma-70 family RNA polymerase sigma factor [Planctomyces sp.]|nr:sigma-70 family RNA polymerase sigma factor [Planctomyces sp.]
MTSHDRNQSRELTLAKSDSEVSSDLGDTFWSEIANRLRVFIRGRVEDVHIADDLVQDVIVKVQRNLTSAPIHRMSAWIFQIARNVVIDHYRSRRHRQSDSLNDETAIADSEKSVVAELTGCIRPMLARLPDESREVLEQTDLGELTQSELAKRLGLSLPGVKSRVQRARELLRVAIVSCCAPQSGVDGNLSGHGCECQPPDYCSQKSGKC